ncbi:hypothetical protein AURDEDRAFT_112840 [Auricularia subglabra TFB-10046 SS5]|nr:hypothetical protein AURDEDRAFT_112840 [Auricularia subglabra TFB-10046 SS5]
MTRLARKYDDLALMALVAWVFGSHCTENALARPIDVAALLNDAETAARLSPQDPTIALAPLLMGSAQVSVGADVADQVDMQGPSSSVTSSPPSSTIVVSSKLPLKATWEPPSDFVDMSSFGINKFAYGQENLALVVGELPILGPLLSDSGGSDASDADPPSLDPTTPSFGWPPEDDPSNRDARPAPSWASPTGTMFQVRYPAGSVNPGSDPRGGADFYALPTSLASAFLTARNVTLAYSVYFPADFDWVKGGKLPGLYGGHETCSGGDTAESCFSTRMMWRDGGFGELYLYAPRDKQGGNVCRTPPKSVCETEYGLSIGRGSFKFTQGGWTRISQTVVLNTPGVADGRLDLDVNGQRAMSVANVYYRNEPTLDQPWSRRTPGDSAASLRREERGSKRDLDRSAATARWRPPIIVFDSPTSSQALGAVGFSGLFFSTFFGGHEEDYATPKDQYSYFGDFSITVNA